MKHGCIFRFGCGTGVRLGNLWESWVRVRVRVRRLKNYYLYFLYIFTIKIFLKNTLLCLDLQNKERRRQETHYYASEVGISTVPAKFKAYFGLFRPFQSPVNMTWYDRYSPIMAESARFGANWAELVRIREKKKLRRGTDARATTSDATPRVGPCQTSMWHPPNRVRAS